MSEQVQTDLQRLIVRLRLAQTGSKVNLVQLLKAHSGVRVRELQGSSAQTALYVRGSLEARLACSALEIRGAQRLRYNVFYKEMGARPDWLTRLTRRDVDHFDAISDHLLIVEKNTSSTEGTTNSSLGVVATYRLLRQEIAVRYGGFHSARIFDVNSLLERHRDLVFLELGRSCVISAYRTKRAIDLLWKGIGSYLRPHKADVMFGTAALAGTDIDRLALPLSFLHHFAAPPEEWRTKALPEFYVEMNRLPRNLVDERVAFGMLPPLIKGYLRAGAYVGDGAVTDLQFGVTFVLIILPVVAISSRYQAHFRPPPAHHNSTSPTLNAQRDGDLAEAPSPPSAPGT